MTHVYMAGLQYEKRNAKQRVYDEAEDSTGLSSHSTSTSAADDGLSVDGFGVIDFTAREAASSAAEAWLVVDYILHNKLENVKWLHDICYL